MNEMGQTVLYFSIKTNRVPFPLNTPMVQALEEGLEIRSWPANVQPQVSGLRRKPRSCSGTMPGTCSPDALTPQTG